MPFLIIVLFVRCSDPTNTQPEIFQNCIFFELVQNKGEQEFQLYRTLDSQESFDMDWRYQYMIKDAEVKILHNGKVNTFIEKYNGDYFLGYMNVDSIEISGEDTCQLLCNTSSNTITGRTIIPGNFNIIYPVEASIHDGSADKPVAVAWSSSKGAYGYYINFKIQEYFPPPYNDVEYSYDRFFTRDTTFMFDKYMYKNGTGTIEIKAIDKNMYENLYEGKEIAGLEGAYGFFGSSLLRAVNIKFVY